MTRNLPASVRGRLENLARETSRPLQELMQYFVMERFLYRLSKSRYADRFVLKGALMFTFWGASDARYRLAGSYKQFSRNNVEDNHRGMPTSRRTRWCGVYLRFDQRHDYQRSSEYSGVRVTFVSKIQNARLPMQIDIGFGDVIHPAAISIMYPTMLDFESPRLVGYPKETVIAEKFEAMVKLAQLNSRMKDFFDIHLLARQFEFDAAVLSLAIQKTFANRGTRIEAKPLVFSTSFLEDASKQTQWTAFVRKSKLAGTPVSFSAVVHDIRDFLEPLTVAIAADQSFTAHWNPGSSWIQS